jgi:hypothetical protein
MQNNDPKSENAAMKERAAKDKDKHGREHNTVPHQHGPAPAEHGAEVNRSSQPKDPGQGSRERK